ncbi:MAG: FMN-binding glutamate synthase family protein [Rhodobacteraceae bacterium]|nr:FMN-binding glutamate synthase family protein [Paracoccaceae bacterium]
MIRYSTFALAIALTVISLVLVLVSPWFWLAVVFFGFFAVIGIRDVRQKRHAILRNYPVLGNLRWIFEAIRPEIRQYLLEGDSDKEPFSRDDRSLVYQRSKGVEDKRPFGTRVDVYAAGYSWMTHSVLARSDLPWDCRVKIGNDACKQPYDASILNISAMSFGALSANAISALNKGAKMGGFAHDTGEGGISCHHRKGGGDLIYEIGSGYFGCRNDDGTFSAEKFAFQAKDPQVKMIEIKLSQGAKPGHGGMLPASKISKEIAEARGIPMNKDCLSPATHSKFTTPLEFVHFLQELRELSGGKPVGFKLCVGHRREFMCMVKAMLETGIVPDFIVVDGKEGGTGAAPLEFADHIGMPLVEGLTFVVNTLVGAGLRDQIKIGAAGKLVTAFDIARTFALGADWVNSARGFMFSIGCVQAQACHTNHCPVGITTQDKLRQRALDVENKSRRVASFHKNTLKAVAEMIGAAGLGGPEELQPKHLMIRQKSGETISGARIYLKMKPGALIDDEVEIFSESYRVPWNNARTDSFRPFEGMESLEYN